MLADEGYKVSTAANGREALNILSETRPDLVVCDLMMPVLDGQQMCRAMQADPRLRSIPVLIMSAVPENVIKADDLVYADVLLKPFSMEVFLEMVRRWTTGD
jgi:CheY-like chemotaxis protein